MYPERKRLFGALVNAIEIVLPASVTYAKPFSRLEHPVAAEHVNVIRAQLGAFSAGGASLAAEHPVF
jgi:hypothetical protein